MSEEVKRPVQGGKRIPKKKVCQFCVDKATEIDYKDVAKLRKYITEKGKMMPRRMTGVCANINASCPTQSNAPALWHCFPTKQTNY